MSITYCTEGYRDERSCLLEAAKEQKREERERQQKSQDGRFSESSRLGN